MHVEGHDEHNVADALSSDGWLCKPPNLTHEKTAARIAAKMEFNIKSEPDQKELVKNTLHQVQGNEPPASGLETTVDFNDGLAQEADDYDNDE